MKILVTGGAGFIGTNFILYWLKNHLEDEIINFDKLTYAGNLENLKEAEVSPNYKFVKGDICDGGVVGKAMEGVDLVVHFAAESHVDRSIQGPAIFVKTNVIGTQVLLENALKHRIKRFHHVSCYDEKTRAFTKNGLKNYWELSEDDEILSLNLKTREIEWKKIAKIIIQDYKGPMIKIKSDRIDFLVTPNHRILLETKKGSLLFKEARRLGARSILPRGFWKSKEKLSRDFMYLLGFFIGDGFLSYQEKELENLTGLTKREYLFLARDPETGKFNKIQRSGPLEKTICRSFRIFLDVPKTDQARRKIEGTLTNLGINWHAHSGKAGEHLYFTSQNFFEILKDCGTGALNKRIPSWALETDQESLKALFEGLIDSDGSRSQNRVVFSTSSRELAENFSELCLKLGLTPHLFVRKSRPNNYKGRTINGRDNYLITVAVTRRSIIPRYGLNHVKEIYYKGKIWCVKVPENKNLLVERNGVFAFCGNTDEVFGSLRLDDPSKFNERTPYNPRSPYSATKAASDHLVRAYYYTYGLPMTITNCSNNFGPYQFPEKFIPLAITNILEGKKVPVYGDGLYVRDWVYVEDHCRAIEMVLRKGRIGETYCVGGLTEDINNLMVVRKILKILGKGEEMIEFVKDRPGHDRRYAIDWSKIKEELGWNPQSDFDTWLGKSVEWYKANQDWWKKVKSGEYQGYYRKQYKDR